MHYLYNDLKLTPTHPTPDFSFFNKMLSLTKEKWVWELHLFQGKPFGLSVMDLNLTFLATALLKLIV